MSRHMILAAVLLLGSAAGTVAQISVNEAGSAPRCNPWPACQFVQGAPVLPGQGGGGVSGTSRPALPGNLGAIRDYRSFTGER